MCGRSVNRFQLGGRSITRQSGRGGYTLLELLLALALTVIVVTLIGNAIFVNMLSLTRVQSSIERKQAARGILGMMQNDIRAGIQFKASDYSGLQDLFTSIEMAAGQTSPISGVDLAAELLPDRSSELDQDDTEAEAVEAAPVFVGTNNSLTVDISRLPRIDQYHPSIPSVKDRVSTISDVKTVSYFVSQSNPVAPVRGRLLESAFSGGLFRRTVDRSVAAYQGIGVVTEPDEYSDLVAAEVADVAFRYFDGSNWQTEWDSETDNGFPLAVEILLSIDPARAIGSGVRNDGGNSPTSVENLERYRVVVHVPVAEIIDPEDSDD